MPTVTSTGIADRLGVGRIENESQSYGVAGTGRRSGDYGPPPAGATLRRARPHGGVATTH